jgi:hypothetical protein
MSSSREGELRTEEGGAGDEHDAEDGGEHFAADVSGSFGDFGGALNGGLGLAGKPLATLHGEGFAADGQLKLALFVFFGALQGDREGRVFDFLS